MRHSKRLILRSALILVVLVLLLVVTKTAQSYNHMECKGYDTEWGGNATTMNISTTSFPIGSSWDTVLQRAMAQWTNVGFSNFIFYPGRDTDGTHASGNGVNEVYLYPIPDGGTLAITRMRWHCEWCPWPNLCNHMEEADIEFNSNLSWTTFDLKYSNLGEPYCFESVALHELGHALGLLHEDNILATMNSYYPNGGPVGYSKEWTPLGDDRHGLAHLYYEGAELDVAATVFKAFPGHPGSSTLVASPDSALLGSAVTIEFGFSNLGNIDATFDVNFYISSDNVIDSSDRLLGTNYGAHASPGFTGVFTRTLTIPSDLKPGSYYLGFVLDSGNTLSESKESNNSQPMPRPIQITAPPDAYETDDDASQAKTIISGKKQTHSIHRVGDVDWVKFTLSDRSEVCIQTDGTSGDTEMYLYGPNSSTTLVEYDDDDGNGNFSLIKRTGLNALVAGTYYVKVQAYGNHSAIKAYTLRLDVTPPDAYEPDNKYIYAKRIINGQTQTRSIHVLGDVDWAKFNLLRRSEVRIQTDGPLGDTEMWLYSLNNNSMTRIEYDHNDGKGNFSLISRTGQKALPPGTYYIKIRAYQNLSTIPVYTLKLEVDPM